MKKIYNFTAMMENVLFKDCGYIFSDNEMQQIDNIFLKYNNFSYHKIRNLMKYIFNFKKYNVDFGDIENRISQILLLGNDSSSLKSYLLRYGDIYGPAIFRSKKESCMVNKAYMIQKMGTVGATEFYQKRGSSLQNFITRYGDDLGNEKWKNYLLKRSMAYKIKREKGHRYPKYNLDYFINLYGIEKGTAVYNEKISKQRYGVSLQRYIDEYGEIEGRKICHNIKDTTSLEKMIKKYGNNKGTKKYIEHRSKFKPSDNFYSKKSKILFDAICCKSNIKAFYGRNEKLLVLNEFERKSINQKIMYLDFLYENNVIEFNGDVFHANPDRFDENDCPHPFKRGLASKIIWEYDNKKAEIIKTRGYNLLVVWESEYENNFEILVEKCINFLGINK